MSEEKIPVFSRLREAGDIGLGVGGGLKKNRKESSAKIASLVNQILF